MSPPCEDFLTADRLHEPETFYPLDVRICERCLLVQLPTYLSAASIFTEYAYFSSYSDTWVEHARRLVDEAIRPPRPRSRIARGRESPATMATCSSTSSRRGSRRSGSSRPATSPPSRPRRGSRPSTTSSQLDGRPFDRGVVRHGRPAWSPTTSSPTSPISTTSRPDSRPCFDRAGCCRSRSPTWSA